MVLNCTVHLQCHSRESRVWHKNFQRFVIGRNHEIVNSWLGSPPRISVVCYT